MKSQLQKKHAIPARSRIELELSNERKLRLEAEKQLRDVDAKHKRLELELNRYREHFESLVANRTLELMAINEKLVQENRDYLLERWYEFFGN